MAIPSVVKLVIETSLISYIEQRVPPHVRDKVGIGYRFRGNSVTLVERRVPFRDPSGEWIESQIAQFRFDPKGNIWSLYWSDRNSKWHKYDNIEATEEFDLLLQEVDKDPTAVFWG